MPKGVEHLRSMGVSSSFLTDWSKYHLKDEDLIYWSINTSAAGTSILWRFSARTGKFTTAVRSVRGSRAGLFGKYLLRKQAVRIRPWFDWLARNSHSKNEILHRNRGQYLDDHRPWFGKLGNCIIRVKTKQRRHWDYQTIEICPENISNKASWPYHFQSKRLL